MIKTIPARPAHPEEPPLLYPFQDAAYRDAQHALAIIQAYGNRPPLPIGQGLSLGA